jgi:hypothetical protein
LDIHWVSLAGAEQMLAQAVHRLLNAPPHGKSAHPGLSGITQERAGVYAQLTVQLASGHCSHIFIFVLLN